MKAGFEGLEELNELQEYDKSHVDSVDEMNRIAGGTYWKDIILQYKKKNIDAYQAEQKITENFCSSLSKAYSYVLNMPIRNKDNNNPKYRMIFATNHPAGCVLMADNMYKRSKELRDERNSGQCSLFDLGSDDTTIDFGTVKENLFSIIPFQETHLSMLEATFFRQFGIPCNTPKLNELIGQLESDGKVAIRREPMVTIMNKPSIFFDDSLSKKGNKVWVRRKQ